MQHYDDGLSSSSVIQVLSDLNNEGASYLERGYWNDATQSLSFALKMAGNILESSSSSSSSMMNERTTPDQHHHDDCCCKNTTPEEQHNLLFRALDVIGQDTQRVANHKNKKKASTTPAKKKNRHEDHHHRQEQFVFDQPVWVETRFQQKKLPNFSEVCIVIVYNLALAYHLQAISSRSIQSQDVAVPPESRTTRRQLRLALNLYKLVTKMKTKERLSCSFSSFSSCATTDHPHEDRFVSVFSFVHSLGLLNNVGQVFKILGRESMAQTCCQQLLTSIMCMVDMTSGSNHSSNSSSANTNSINNHDGNSVKPHDMEHLDGFLLNVSHLILKTNVAGAA